MKEITERIVSPFSAEVTRDKTTAIFKGLGFEVERRGEEYYAHKGSAIAAVIVGVFAPKFDIYYTMSEVEGKTVVNLRAPISFWRGGGLLGMAKQESKFKEVVATLTANLTTTGEEKAVTTAPVAGVQFCPNCGTKVSETQRFCPNCGTDLITGVTVKKATIARKIGAAVSIAIGLFIILIGLFGIGSGMDHNSAPETIFAMSFIAIGIGITWFGWSHRR